MKPISEERDEYPERLGQTSYRRASDAIRHDIINGRFNDGDRVTTTELADRYQLSLAPIREALHQLAAEGIIVMQPKRGAIVRTITPEFLEEIYEVKLGLVPYLDGQRAQLATPADVAHLIAIEARYERALHRQDFSDAILANRLFHQAMRKLKVNHEADRIIARHDGLIEALRLRYGFASSRSSEIVREHRALIDAYRDRDAAKAQEVSRIHLLRSYTDLLDLLTVE